MKISFDDLTAYTLFDRMLADCFNALSRDNWPDGTESIVTDLINEWESKYKGEEDNDLKIKNEYLCWLTENNWHTTYMAYSPVTSDEKSDESIRDEERNDRYNTRTLLHSVSFEGESSINGQEKRTAAEMKADEISWIKTLLQNGIDMFLIGSLKEELTSSGLDAFNELLQQSCANHLSEEIYQFLVNLSNDSSKERAQNLLKSYLSSTVQLLVMPSSMYLEGVWQEYLIQIINGDKEIDDCCAEIYENVFVGIPSRKSNHSSEYEKDCNMLKESIMLETGKMLSAFIKNDSTKARDSSVSIIYDSSKKDGSP